MSQATAEGLPKLAPLEARTLVDQVVDAVIEGMATGVFLPGDRVIEAEVARALNVSRVPVREALRLLESQGVVLNERYRGMRLMEVSAEGLDRIQRVRAALETLAVEEILARLPENPDLLAPLEEAAAALRRAAEAGDSYGVARLDTAFHRQLCQLSGNDVIVKTWEPLSRQLTVIFGLSTLEKDMASIAEEHDDVLRSLQARAPAPAVAMIRRHILDYSREIDFEKLVAARRQQRKQG